jgi:hypothetical protein
MEAIEFEHLFITISPSLLQIVIYLWLRSTKQRVTTKMEISYWISHVKNKAKKKVHESWDFNARIWLINLTFTTGLQS